MMRMPFLLWLFPFVITLHNAEEAIWLPGWSQSAGRWTKPTRPKVFRFAVAVLTILAYVITWMAIRAGKQTIWAHLTFGYIVATLANAVAPHLVVTVASRRYMPGLATGLLLNVPVLSILMWLALKLGYVSGWKAAADCIVVPILLLLSIPALFRIGEAVIASSDA